MEKVCKVIFIIFIIISIYGVLFPVEAADIWGDASKFVENGYQQWNRRNSQWVNAKSSFKSLIGFLWGVALLVLFISTVILGIKYMMVNPNEKSRIKQSVTPYAIGVVVIFGATTIWRLLISILEG